MLMPPTMRTTGSRFICQSFRAWKYSLQRQQFTPSILARYLSFSFAGPRKLDDIVKKDLLQSKSTAEVVDIWYSYHESKDKVLGLVLAGKDAKTVLSRAAQCPFFVQPVFRDDGYFMMMTQFQQPAHFLMAYLEDYKMDPSSAQPLMTFSVFDDFSEEKDLTLVRCDILNNAIENQEGLKVVQNLLDVYKNEDEFVVVHSFNKAPQTFDLDEFIEKQNKKWRNEPPAVNL